jgi:hypothetical protein
MAKPGNRINLVPGSLFPVAAFFSIVYEPLVWSSRQQREVEGFGLSIAKGIVVSNGHDLRRAQIL